MFPELFKIGPLSLKTYGLFLALGYFAGIAWAFNKAKRENISPKFILDLALLVIITSLLGGRIFYVIFHPQEFKGHWLDVINPFQSTGEIGIYGLSMMGGVILAVLSGILYINFKNQNLWKIADLSAPALALGLFIGRWGCFFNGCCFGLPTTSFMGIKFPESCPAGYVFPGEHLYPTQIFSSFKGLLIFLILIWADKKKKFDGSSFTLMLMLFSIGRFVIDFFRYYENEMVMTGFGNVKISVNQGVTVIIFFCALLLHYILKKRALREAK